MNIHLLMACIGLVISFGLARLIIWLLRYFKQPTLSSMSEVASLEEIDLISAEHGHAP